MIKRGDRVRLILSRKWANVIRYLLGLERGYIYQIEIQIGDQEPIDWRYIDRRPCEPGSDLLQ